MLTGSNFDSSQDNVTTGFGIDARLGYTFSQTHEHAFTVALELTPTLLSNRGESARYTGIGFTFGCLLAPPPRVSVRADRFLEMR